jgi:hypothetical protein
MRFKVILFKYLDLRTFNSLLLNYFEDSTNLLFLTTNFRYLFLRQRLFTKLPLF